MSRGGKIFECLIVAVLLHLSCGGTPDIDIKEPSSIRDAGAEEAIVDVPLHAEVGLYIRVSCRYAAEAMRSMVQLKRILGDAIELRVGYIGLVDANGEIDESIGEAEVSAARAQVCAGISADDAQWLDFLDCVYSEDNWRSMPSGWGKCIQQAGLDADEVKDCLDSGEGEALLARAYGISMMSRIHSSPTIIIGDTVYLGSRTKEALLRYICHSAGKAETMPAACGDVAPPETIAATLLFDSRCHDPAICETSDETSVLERLIPGLELTQLDFSTEQGRRLFTLIQKANNQIKELPLIVIDQGLDNLVAVKERMQDYLLPFGKGYVLEMGAGWDPLAEICDNEIDDNDDGATDCEDLTCSEKKACRAEKEGRLDLFIMSGCPYAARLIKVVDRFLAHFGRDREQIDLHLQFVGNVVEGRLVSMHGEEEIAENMRMLCAEKLYPKNYRFMEYITCRAEHFDSPSWESCLPSWMDKKKLLECANGDQGREYLEESFKLAQNLGVRGSPTWILNNHLPMEGRDLKTIVDGFCAKNERPACAEKVSSGGLEIESTVNSTCH